jgi:hypothetical protein
VVAAVGIKIGLAVGAGRGEGDAIRRKTGGPELKGVGLAQVEEIFAGTTGRGKKPGRKSGLKKFAADIFADFVTGRPDARPHRRDQIRRFDVEAIPHDPDGPFNDSSPGSTPTGVNGGDDAPPLVGEEQGKTIRSLDDEKETGFLRDQSIALRALGRRFVDDMHDIGMDLAEKNGLKTPFGGENPKIVFGERPGPETMEDTGERG